ncbi:hypothetical protein VDGL01_02622 [Verticillium dahliae]
MPTIESGTSLEKSCGVRGCPARFPSLRWHNERPPPLEVDKAKRQVVSSQNPRSMARGDIWPEVSAGPLYHMISIQLQMPSICWAARINTANTSKGNRLVSSATDPFTRMPTRMPDTGTLYSGELGQRKSGETESSRGLQSCWCYRRAVWLVGWWEDLPWKPTGRMVMRPLSRLEGTRAYQ